MKKLVVLTILLTSLLTQAQNFKFGKVSKEELQETVHPIDEEANAAILYRSQNIEFNYDSQDGFTQQNTIYQRIKIYNKEGYDWATKKVKLYNKTGSSSENLVGLKGYTYTLSNGKIEKTKLKKENIFENETNKYWASKTFTMPNIKEGCVIEFEYKIQSPYISIDDILVQYTIPLNKIDVQIATPEYFNYNKIVNPRAVVYPEVKESKRSRKETIRAKSRSGNMMPGRQVNTNVTTNEFEFLENVITINMDNIPALIDEPFVDNLDNYRGKLALEYSYYRGPDGQTKSYATTWDKVTETIYKNEGFGDQLNRTNYYEDDLKKLLAGSSSDNESIFLIFEFVKSKVKWNDYIGYTSESGVKKAYKEGTGNIGDINLMLTSMLRYANINANPVLLSTRDNGVPLFPTRSGFNYVVCAVQNEKGMMLLDASQNYAKPNVLPIRALNWQGRLIREDGSSGWVNLSPQNLSKEIVSTSAKLNEDLTISGKARKTLTNYQAFGYRNRNFNKNTETLIQNLEKNNVGLIVSNFEIKNLDILNKPVSQSYEYVYDNAAEKIGENIYLSPLLFLRQEENPFTQDTRNYPIDFIYPISDKYMINIEIPEGYQVESLPENSAVKFNNEALNFSYLVKQTGNTIQLIVNLDIKNVLILPSDYEIFKQFYKTMIEKKSEKIVLKKV